MSNKPANRTPYPRKQASKSKAPKALLLQQQPQAVQTYVDACHTCKYSQDVPDAPADIFCRRRAPVPIPVPVIGEDGPEIRVFSHFPRLNRVTGHCGEYEDKPVSQKPLD